MIYSDKMLLIASGPAGDEIASRMGDANIVRCDDPYAALQEMADHDWPAVLLAAEPSELESLGRASRRLQSAAKLYALCPPAAELKVRPLAGDVIDDYFISPPSPQDVCEMTEAVFGSARIAQPATVESFTTADFAQLIDAASSMSDLESCIANMVNRRCELVSTWKHEAEVSPEREVLLLTAGDPPRVLTAERPQSELPDQQRSFLARIQDCLPGLIKSAKRTESLQTLAVTDYLTGAYNRRYFYNITDQILRRSGNENFRVAMMLFDIDNFKRYNDTYGHAAGDEILKESSQLIKQVTRDHDIVARIGGDEFAVLFWDADQPRQADSKPPESVLVITERFRAAVAKHEFPSLGSEARGSLGISGGLSTFPNDGKTCRALLRSADAALRSVKQTGKNAIKLIGR